MWFVRKDPICDSDRVRLDTQWSTQDFISNDIDIGLFEIIITISKVKFNLCLGSVQLLYDLWFMSWSYTMGITWSTFTYRTRLGIQISSTGNYCLVEDVWLDLQYNAGSAAHISNWILNISVYSNTQTSN